MFDVKYILSIAIPFVILAVYAIALQQETIHMAVLARSDSQQKVFEIGRNYSVAELSQPSTIDEPASSYEIFVLERSCSLPCQERVSKSLREQFGCTKIIFLQEFHYIQARCDGSGSMSPHEVGEEVVRKVLGVKRHVDDRKLPSVSIGERVDGANLFSRPHTESKFVNMISRLTQSVSWKLPWSLDRIDQKEGTDGKLDLSCFPNRGKGVTLYILDTGCRDTHEDLQDRTTLATVLKYSTAMDDTGHGTHVAGIAAGTYSGVCKLCDIVCIKTLDENNIGTIVDILDSIEHVLERKKANPQAPAVVVLSLGGPLGTDTIDIAVNKLAKANVFPAVAAGNGYTNSCDWSPPRAKHAITVGATMQDDSFRFSSNFGECVSIVAPGEDVHSASHLGDSLYVSMSGTSMAAPYVAGVAALMLGEDPDLTPKQIRRKMKLNSKILEDGFHYSKYPMLRILRRKCKKYGFRKRESSNPQGTPEVPQQKDNPPAETEQPSNSISSISGAAPMPSSSPMPSACTTVSIVKSPSISPSPSTSVTPSYSNSPSPAPSPSSPQSPSASSLPKPSTLNSNSLSTRSWLLLSELTHQTWMPSARSMRMSSASLRNFPSPTRSAYPSESVSQAWAPATSSNPTISVSLSKSQSISSWPSPSELMSQPSTPCKSLFLSSRSWLSMSSVTSHTPSPNLEPEISKSQSVTPTASTKCSPIVSITPLMFDSGLSDMPTSMVASPASAITPHISQSYSSKLPAPSF